MNFSTILGIDNIPTGSVVGGSAHNPYTCPICQSIRQFETDAAYAYAPATRCYWGFAGCNCWGEAQEELAASELPVITLVDLGLVEDYSELSRVIAEVRVGNILLPDEGETLLDALVEEEQAHAETLADLGDAEDRIAELEDELAAKDEALALAMRTLDLATRVMERQNEQARATILAGSLFAAAYI